MKKVKFFIILNLICAANINANIFNRLVGHAKFLASTVRLVRLVNKEQKVLSNREHWRLIDPKGKREDEFGQSILYNLEWQARDLDQKIDFEYRKLDELDKIRKGKKGQLKL